MSDWRIPLSDLDYGEEEKEALLRVLAGKWLSMGPEVQTFEREFAGFLGVKHALAVANGTAALHLAYLALGLGPGDEVIQPAINFVAAANMTAAVGATPVFADILGLDEPTIDPREVERQITPRTKAVVAMHYGGCLCRMGDISALCRRHGLALVEDACHAVGARHLDPAEPTLHDRMAGALGDVASFSFFSNKNLATGEGGMVTTDRDDLAERLRLLRSHGMTTLTWERHKGHASSYEVVANGFNYRLDELHAALGRAQLAKLSHNNQRRRRLLALYAEHLKPLAGWIIPFADNGGDTSGHLMVAVAPTTEMRTRVAQKLRESRVQTSMHYPCICDFKAFARGQAAAADLSREFTSRAMTLPLFPTMTEAQVKEVCVIIKATA